MKHPILSRPAALIAALLLAGHGQLAAQSAVPTEMTYQAFVTDSSNNPLAATTPANYDVKFRIYGSATGSDVIWAEQQTVTIFEGNFSVLLGNGQEIGTEPGTEPKPAFDQVFADEMRYMGITVGSNAEFTPRQRILPNAYAFRAKVAETAESVGGGLLSHDGNTVSVTGGLSVTGAITGDNVSGNGAGITALNLGATTTGSLEDRLLSGNVALLDRDGQTFTGNNTFNGKVGIGEGRILEFAYSPPHLGPPELGVSGGAGTKLVLWPGNAANTPFALGMEGGAIWYGSSGAHKWYTGTASMVIDSTGNVGIGTESPSEKLEVVGNVKVDGGIDIPIGKSLSYASNNRFDVAGGASIAHYGLTLAALASPGARAHLSGYHGVHFYTAEFDRMSINQLGNVGIGTAPTKAKLEVEGGPNTSYTGSLGYLNPDGAHGLYTSPFSQVTSIYGSGAITGLAFYAVSDERIKDISGRTDSSEDLTTLLDIEVKNYTYKDRIAKGSRIHKKVIAQQVEKVFPQAVSKRTDEVPDIYQKAMIKDGWVTLRTDLKPGERVKLIAEKEKGIYEVLELRDGAFRTAFAPATDKVFVYGREVDDFRSVDYEAIAMLNVSATQELARRVQSQDAEIAALKKQLSELGGRLAANEGLEARLAKLETRLVQRVATSD